MMTRVANSLFYWAVVYFLSSLFNVSMASQVVAQNSNQNSLQKGKESNDLLLINPPNAQGISINRFSSFSIDKPLDLVNLSKNSQTRAAEVIIIQAPSIQLKDTISLIGPKADIIFIGTGNGASVKCTPCRIENSLRLALVAGNGVALSSGRLRPLTSKQGSYIQYTQMNAPGALAIELIADNVNLPAGNNSLIDTTEKAKRHSNGGFVADENGALVMGGGAVNIRLGKLSWNFSTQQLTTVSDAFRPNSSINLVGKIKSTSITVTSAYSLVVNSTMDTRSDLVSSFRYKGRMITNDETITLTTPNKDKYNLALLGNTYTDGQITLNTLGRLTLGRIHGKSVINAGSLLAYAKKSVLSRANISADTIQIAGESLINSAPLQGLSRIELFADKNLTNQSEITADNVVIESDSGTFLNGDRGIANAKSLNVNITEYNESSNPTRRGFIFNSGLSHRGGLGSIKRGASVYAQNLHIKVKNLENINPYYARDADNDGKIDLETEYFNQVRLSAENELLVRADGYIVNASGVMEQSAPSGRFHMQAKTVVNDRYAIYNGLLDVVRKNQFSNFQTTSREIASSTHIYSPPGRFVAFGHLYLGATQAIVNNSSYIEAYQNADFYTPQQFHEIGIHHQNITQTTGVNDAPIECGGQLSPENNRRRERQICEVGLGTIVTNRVVAADIRTLDSLLFVQGRLNANQAKFSPITVKPYTYYQMQAIKQKQNALFNRLFRNGSTKRRKTYEINGSKVTLKAFETIRERITLRDKCEIDGQPVIGPVLGGAGDSDEIRCGTTYKWVDREYQVGKATTLALFPLMANYYSSQLATHNKLMQRIR